MVVNEEEIFQLNQKLRRLELDRHMILGLLKDKSLGEKIAIILNNNKRDLETKIRATKRAIEWEETRYDYLHENVIDKLNELKDYLGKEVKVRLC